MLGIYDQNVPGDKKRDDFNDPLLEMISFVGPDEILKHRSQDLLPSLVDLVEKSASYLCKRRSPNTR